eukprot:g233.t1
MSTTTLEDLARKPWKDLEKRGHLKDALLALDDNAAEAIAWIGGLSWITSLGTLNVVSTDVLFEQCGATKREAERVLLGAKKVVICTTSYVWDIESSIVRIVGSNLFDEVIVLSSVTESAHRIHHASTKLSGPFRFSDISRKIQMAAMDEFARFWSKIGQTSNMKGRGVDGSTKKSGNKEEEEEEEEEEETNGDEADATAASLRTYVDISYFAVHFCPLFEGSQKGIGGSFILNAKECRDTTPLTMTAYVPKRNDMQDRFNLVSGGVDVLLADKGHGAQHRGLFDDADDEKSSSSKRRSSSTDVTNIWNVDVSDLVPLRRRGLVRTAHELRGALRSMGLRVKDSNAFAIGHSSELVGNKLMSVISAETDERAASGRVEEDDPASLTECSILLIDRTLDLVAATQHGAHGVDDARRRYDARAATAHSSEKKKPFLCHNGNSAARTLFRQFILQGTYEDDDCGADVPNVVTNILARLERKFPLKTTTYSGNAAKEDAEGDGKRCAAGKPTVFERTKRLLDAGLNEFKTSRARKEWFRRLDSLDLIEAMSDRTNVSSRATERELGVMERMQRELGCATEDPLLQLADMLRRPSSVVPIKDVLTLAVHTFSLFGSKQVLMRSAKSLKVFESALSDAILRARSSAALELECLGFVDIETIVALQKLTSKEDSLPVDVEKKIRREISDVVLRLIEAGNVRTQLSKDSRFASLQSKRVSCGYRPFVRQLFQMLLSPERPDVDNDMKRVGSVMQQLTSGVSDLMGAAFSTFGWSATPAKPRPTDLSTLVVFFVGGFTAFEMSIVDDELRKYHKCARDRNAEPTYGAIRVIVGGTSLSSGASLQSSLLSKGSN